MENRTVDMQENWIAWNPSGIPRGKYIVTSFIQNIDGVQIILDDGKNIVEILFDGIPSIIRISIEGIRMRTWGEVQRKYHDKFYFHDWFLYKVENSELSKWGEEESCGFYEAVQLTHYCVVTGEEIIDVLASFEPIVKMPKCIR